MSVTATGFITDLTLKEAVAAALSKRVSDLDADIWDGPITVKNLGAYNQIVSAWVGAGYTLANVQDWILGATFQENLALFEVLIKQEPNSQMVGEWRIELDWWRQRLDKLVEDESLVLSGGTLADLDDGSLFEIHSRGI